MQHHGEKSGREEGALKSCIDLVVAERPTCPSPLLNVVFYTSGSQKVLFPQHNDDLEIVDKSRVPSSPVNSTCQGRMYLSEFPPPASLSLTGNKTLSPKC